MPADLNVSTVKELAARIKVDPGKLNYASVTGANDLLFAAWLKTEKLDMAKVPYKDAVQAINDLAEGRIHAFVGAYAIMRPRVQAGKVKVVALTNRQHAKALNDIPTAAEAGYKSLEFDGLVGLFGPGDFPSAVRDRIAGDIRDVLSDPEIDAKLSATGQVVNPGTAAEFTAALDDQRVDCGKNRRYARHQACAVAALAFDQPHDRLGRAADMRNRNKRKNSGHWPAGNEGFEPSRYEIRAQADIGEGDNSAHHEHDERTDHDRKYEPGFAFHRFPIAMIPITEPDFAETLRLQIARTRRDLNRNGRPVQGRGRIWQGILILNGIDASDR